MDIAEQVKVLEPLLSSIVLPPNHYLVTASESEENMEGLVGYISSKVFLGVYLRDWTKIQMGWHGRATYKLRLMVFDLTDAKALNKVDIFLVEGSELRFYKTIQLNKGWWP